MFRIAFYKGKGNCFNGLIRFWDGGPYSHCELVFSDGLAASASWQDGRQVRRKFIDFNPDHWDFIELPAHLELRARYFLEATEGMRYDLFGQLRFVVAPLQGAHDGYWCSEWCAEALGFDQAYRQGPNGLAAILLGLTTFLVESPAL